MVCHFNQSWGMRLKGGKSEMEFLCPSVVVSYRRSLLGALSEFLDNVYVGNGDVFSKGDGVVSTSSRVFSS